MELVYFVCFDLILNFPVNTLTKQGYMCLAQGHHVMTPVRLEPGAPRSQAKHSTTESLLFLGAGIQQKV